MSVCNLRITGVQICRPNYVLQSRRANHVKTAFGKFQYYCNNTGVGVIIQLNSIIVY